MKRPILLLLAALVITLAVYWPGLSGGYLLDDDANLAAVWRWLAGETGWLQVVLGNESGPLGRPVSMASFVATAAIWGQSAFAFKAVNLGIHLTVAVFIYLSLNLLFRRDRVLHGGAAWAALAVTSVWLLHPLFTSTVLYVVQRMAMLSALFVIIGLWAYLRGRVSVEEGRLRAGAAWLLVAVPLLTALATLSKETGLLLPLLCGVIEWTHFTPPHGHRRTASVRWFVGLFIVAPLMLGSLYLLTHPEFFLSGYENRPFDLSQRLLTQSRVLFDYVGSLLLPVGQDLSIYRDDYQVSGGLLQPATTLFSLLGWLAIVFVAVVVRRSIPGFTAGVGIFLVGHAMESTIFPLLIYFEHRNYLPGLGILIAAASLMVFVGQALRARMDRPLLVFGGAAAGLLMVLSFATLARTLAWQSPMTLLEQSVARYPDSRFARMELAALIMNQGPARDSRAAAEHYRHLQGLDRPSTRSIGFLGEMAVNCFAIGRAQPENLDKAFSRQPETIQDDYLKAVEELAQIARRQECDGISLSRFADHLTRVANDTHLAQADPTVWRLRFEAAKLYAAEGQDRRAMEQAKEAWQTGNADLPVGMLIAGLHIRLAEFGSASRMLDQIGPRIPGDDRTGQALLESYRSAIEEGTRNSILAPTTNRR